MKRTLIAVWAIAALCVPGPGFALAPLTLGTPGMAFALVQDKPDPRFASLDAQLEIAAVTAQLIRSYSAVLALAEQNQSLMAVMRRLLPPDKDPASQQQAREATLRKEAQIRDARDTALESYLRLIGDIENNFSMEDVTARTAAVDRAMDFRGQGSIKTALPAILLHIHLIHEHAAPSRETVLQDIEALSNR